MTAIPFFPARPVNGGALETAIKLGALNRALHGDRCAEPKMNGWRLLVNRFTGEAWNRHGEPSSIAEEFARPLAELAALPKSFPELVDCEALERRHGRMRGSLIVLDAINHHDGVPYMDRRKQLEDEIELFHEERDPSLFGVLRLVPSWTAEFAREMYRMLQLENQRLDLSGLNSFYEGIVLKSADSLYPRQRISAERETATWVKHRFA